ncbi:MAG: endopeptidase La [Lachnospiraceae bacterium]|nr:endopeptidase La [Lachnospiraceae bacterium]
MRKKNNDEIKTMPCVVIAGLTLLTNVIIHFDLVDGGSLAGVNAAMMGNQEIFIVTRKNEEAESIETEDLYTVGTVAKVRQIVKMPDNEMRVMVETIDRAQLISLNDKDDYVEAEIRVFADIDNTSEIENTAMCRDITERFSRFISFFPKVGHSFEKQLAAIKKIGELCDIVISNMPLEYTEKQKVLEAIDVSERYKAVREILDNEIEIAKIKTELADKIQVKVNNDQKNYILREQLQYIREELGEDNTDDDADKYLQQCEALDAPDEVKERIRKVIDRFRNTPSGSSESGVEQVYIETLLELPWNKESEENKSLENAKNILERDHYGLDKVKERMLEFLAVKNLTAKGQSPIICLVGPPGTGKTSIARSVAEALQRKYIRISLGGVRDEAEIRGHRKTYIGAMPGVIASGLQRAGVNNPLILLDEIDKVSSDYQGATASALLEVLDSEQNKEFRDHYVEVPIDLSNVLFIATANSTDSIPRPLLDRMEVVEVSGYTENEKMHIAKEHLVAKQIKKNGLKKSNLRVTDAALHKIIDGYTREAGVRSLERRIGEICRKVAKSVYNGDIKSVTISEKNIEKYLGNVKYLPEEEAGEDSVGIVRGLAWTAVGGVTLEVEVNIMPGKGLLVLTGQLGDVMKESAQAAMTYVRAISEDYGISASYYKEHDFHIHIPEGATPKDGPSAGVTMATAIFSAVTKTKVRADVAMTGEITLRGRVLPIGGLREKILAAKNAKIMTVLVPDKNRRDVDEISDEIKEGMDIRYMTEMMDVLKAAMCNMPPHASPKEKKKKKKAEVNSAEDK